MNDLTVFQNSEFGEIRTVEENGEVLFCGTDVARALGYVNPRDAVGRRCRGVVKRDAYTNKRRQEMTFIPESDLYRLVFSSKLPSAERFVDWVTEEVLPSIRKTGRYENRPMTVAENLAAQAQLLVEQEKRIERIEQRMETALTAIARPSADTWVPDMAEAMKRYCEAKGLTEPVGRGRLYAMLDREANCSTDARLRRLRARQKEIGKRYKDYMALTKLDAIAEDKKLRVAFEGIVARETARVARE